MSLQASSITNIYTMRNRPPLIRNTVLPETTVHVLVAEAFRDKVHAPAYIGAAERILEKIQNPDFVAKYKKRISFYRNQFYPKNQQEVKKQKKIPERLAVPRIEELIQMPV